MARTPMLSSLLWLALGACGDDGGANHLPDAPHADANPAQPTAVVASSLALMSPCGVAMPDTVDLPIMNGGTSDLVVSAADAPPGFTVTTALPLTIAAGATTPLTIRPPAAVIGTDLGGDTKTGTLTLTTNDSDGSHAIALTSTIAGANVQFFDQAGDEVSTATLDGTGGVCPAPRSLTIANSGTSPVTIDQGTTTGFSGFGFAGFSGATIGGTSSTTITIDMQNSMSQCSGTGSVTFVATADNLCTPTPSITLEYSVSGASGACFCS
ncbi:MAG TPA: hypothetical protein VGM88_10600 [Kofleriaceae bacterium]|jgi:hypothetical protein